VLEKVRKGVVIVIEQDRQPWQSLRHHSFEAASSTNASRS
jgi:hypothetical protein